MPGVSAPQLRAARALLNWSRGDLSRESGISEQTIHRFENGSHGTAKTSLQKIVKVLETAGVQFLEGNGVKFKINNIEVFEGPQRFDEFFEFIFEHLKDYGGDVCVGSADERLYIKYRKNPELHRMRMRKLMKMRKISYRILTLEGDYHLTGSTYAKYRWIPKDSFAPTSFYAFGECLALISFVHDPAPYVVLHKSGPFAEAYRRAFDVAWEKAKNPPPEALEIGVRLMRESQGKPGKRERMQSY